MSQSASTEKQRAWVAREAGEEDPGEYLNLVSSGKAPRGREVEPAPVLRVLPKRPPPRRRDDE